MKTLQVFFLFLLLFICRPGFAVHRQVMATQELQQSMSDIKDLDLSAFGAMNVEQFLALRPKDIRKQTGKRMKFKEVLALKAAQKRVKKALKGTDDKRQRKNQLTALLLCLFVGALGIHRFYLGYTGIGIIQLLTGGLCGIWTLIDLIRIAVNELPASDGTPLDPI